MELQDMLGALEASLAGLGVDEEESAGADE
jgi:hypothetical protein